MTSGGLLSPAGKGEVHEDLELRIVEAHIRTLYSCTALSFCFFSRTPSEHVRAIKQLLEVVCPSIFGIFFPAFSSVQCSFFPEIPEKKLKHYAWYYALSSTHDA